MKKLASILAVTALALGGVALSTAPAMAQPTGLSASPSVIESGGALTLDLTALQLVAPASCALFMVDGKVEFSGNAGNSTGPIPASITAVQGENAGFNVNGDAVPHTFAMGIYPVVSGLCSDLNPASLPTPTHFAEWTVNPALTVAPIAPFTTGVADSQTLPTSVSNPTAGPIDAALASSWSVSVGAVCPVPLVTGVAPAIDVALPTGLSIDGTLSAVGVVPALTITGTPAAGTAGDYLVCFTRTDSNGMSVGALVTITVADPVAPELAKTGVDGMQDGVLAGGAALIALLGAAAFVLVRRRTASV